jgi:hypothetical protein
VVVFVGRVARPNDADTQALPRWQAVFPEGDSLVWDTKIRNIRVNRGELGPKCKWQAQQGAMQIEFGNVVAAADHLNAGINLRNQGFKRRLHFEHHACASLFQQCHIACELDCVTEALFVMHKDRLALDRGIAEP